MSDLLEIFIAILVCLVGLIMSIKTWQWLADDYQRSCERDFQTSMENLRALSRGTSNQPNPPQQIVSEKVEVVSSEVPEEPLIPERKRGIADIEPLP
jgi:hypothetical protein